MILPTSARLGIQAGVGLIEWPEEVRRTMGKPDSQQIGLAGEYYVAFVLSRLGYDIGITIGRAKIFDMVAVAPSGKEINIQVKATYSAYVWLVSHRRFSTSKNSVVALVRLDKYPTEKPELYFLPGEKANDYTSDKYKTHSDFIKRTEVRRKFKDHDFRLIERLLGKPGEGN